MADAEAPQTVYSPLVTLARRAIEAYVVRGRVLPARGDLPPGLPATAGTFVSLKKFGELRGCIGTIEPTQESLEAEVICNAIAAVSRDPRFYPVQPHELPDLTVSVDVLGSPEPVADLNQFDPRRYGMILQSGPKRGLLLPDLPGVDTAEQQYAIVCRKAGILPGEPVDLFRFVVTRFY